jgi:hypothetical protein
MLNIKYNNPYKDIEYAKALLKLGAYDQAYFNEIGIAFRKFGMRSSVASALWRLKFMIQEKNQKELEQLVAAKGWPKLEKWEVKLLWPLILLPCIQMMEVRKNTYL